jgi:hypothetical protein
MDWDERLEEAPEARNEALAQLIEFGTLDGSRAGIARQVIGQGLGSLSPKQAAIFQEIADEHLLKECPRCHDEIPLDELVRFSFDGLCYRCAKRETEED